MPRPAVRTQRLGAVVRITLARPEMRNAQNTRLILELDRAMRAARKDDAVRGVILHGTKTAMDALAERRRLGSMRELIAARDRGVARRRAR